MCFYEQDQHTQKDHRKIDSLEKQQNKTVVVMTTFSAKKGKAKKKSKMIMAITGVCVCVDDFNFKFFVLFIDLCWYISYILKLKTTGCFNSYAHRQYSFEPNLTKPHMFLAAKGQSL